MAKMWPLFPRFCSHRKNRAKLILAKISQISENKVLDTKRNEGKANNKTLHWNCFWANQTVLLLNEAQVDSTKITRLLSPGAMSISNISNLRVFIRRPALKTFAQGLVDSVKDVLL